MKKKLFYFIALGAFLISDFSFAQLTISVTPPNGCFTPGATATAIVTGTPVGAVSFSWTVTSGISICSAGNTVTPISPTMALITFGCCGNKTIGCSAYAAGNVLITSTTTPIALPCNTSFNATANPPLVCAGGGTTSLSASGTATNYSWNFGPSGSTATVLVLSATVYTVIASFATGCTNTATVGVNILTPTVTVTPPSATTCPGIPVTLSASGANSYTWTPPGGGPPAPFSNISVSPLVNSVYTLASTSTSNTVSCVKTTTVPVYIISAPIVTAAVTPTIACAGAQVTLTASGANTYTWNTSQQGSVVTVTIPSSGQATYTVSGSSGNCASLPFVLSVPVLAGPLISISPNTASICAGTTITLTANGAQSYTWSNNAIAPSITVTAVNGAIYSVTGTGINTCNNTSTYNIVANPLPTVILNSTKNPACSLETVTLSASGAQTYTWSNNAVAASITLAAVAGLYSVTGQDANACMNTAAYTLSVNPSPTITANANKTVICKGEKVTLTPGGGISYTWSPVAGSGTLALTPTATTQYTLYGKDNLGCENSSTVTVTVNKCSGMTEKISEGTVAIYPNPGNGTYVIAGNFESDKTIRYTLEDLSGRSILKGESFGTNLIEIKTEAAPGTYILRIYEGERSLAAKKLIIVR